METGETVEMAGRAEMAEEAVQSEATRAAVAALTGWATTAAEGIRIPSTAAEEAAGRTRRRMR